MKKRYILFGHPISHSAAPSFHNYIWQNLDPNRQYVLHDTTQMDLDHLLEKIQAELRQGTFAGAAVTMPWKTKIIKSGLLDYIQPAACQIGAINTIYISPSGQLIGDNTDWIGIQKALGVIRENVPSAGLIIGSGATARSAAYALNQLNLSPIYLINRNLQESLDLIANFPSLDLRHVPDLKKFTLERTGIDVPILRLVVGCIPSDVPQTKAEKLVYELAKCFFNDLNRHQNPIFLEMAYKPRQTPMVITAQQAGWNTIGGIHAMIEQGLAQIKIWLKNPEPFIPIRTEAQKNSNDQLKELIPQKLEIEVRKMILNMNDL
ncbi:hypothetical protein O181_095116 [Austropuccinia psidii MF-1]|uniref:Shikimate dehydrogenase substrate binding N-terminal domain-containing protein n=1 Tax=Austropuccinia psidii MF-1 TaxID=1389203 RepID=A0A9Q3J4H7_9BASI|nr:hypothetical protein [Austropuccinia psidii MF-1]